MNTASLPEYITALTASGTVSSYISLGVLGFFLLSVLFGFIFGLSRGLGKASTRLVTIVTSAVISLIVATSIPGAVSDFFAGKTLEEVILSISPEYANTGESAVTAFIASCDAETAELLVQLISSLVIIPLVFVICFIVLNALMMIVFWIISAAAKLGKGKKGALSRLLGALIGTLQGALVAAVCLLPLAGISATALEVRQTLDEAELTEEMDASVDKLYDETLGEIISNPLFTVINQCGGEALYSSFSRIDVAGTSVDARDELDTVISVYSSVMEIKASGFDFKNPTPEQIDAIADTLDIVANDPYAAEVVAGVLRALSVAIHTERIPVGLENPYHDLAISLTDIFLETYGDNLGFNLDTIISVYAILGDSGVLAALSEGNADAVEDLLITEYNSDGNVINAVIAELKGNPATKPVVTSLTKLSIALFRSNPLCIIRGGYRQDRYHS